MFTVLRAGLAVDLECITYFMVCCKKKGKATKQSTAYLRDQSKGSSAVKQVHCELVLVNVVVLLLF